MLDFTFFTPPLNNQLVFHKINIFQEQEKVEHLLPFKLNSGLGYDFALARGFCGICLGLDDPRGGSCFLYGKAGEDYEGIRQLVMQRLGEREALSSRDVE